MTAVAGRPRRRPGNPRRQGAEERRARSRSRASSSASPRPRPATALPRRSGSSSPPSVSMRRAVLWVRSSRCSSSRPAPTTHEQGRPGLRHHVLVGDEGVRAAGRAGSAGWALLLADILVMASLSQIAGRVHVPPVRRGQPRSQHVLGHRRRGDLDRGDDLDLLRRDRGVGEDAVVPARGRDRDARPVRGRRAAKVYAADPGLGPPVPELAQPVRISSTSALIAGVLTAIFIYWGWDTAVARQRGDRGLDPHAGRSRRS